MGFIELLTAVVVGLALGGLVAPWVQYRIHLRETRRQRKESARQRLMELVLAEVDFCDRIAYRVRDHMIEVVSTQSNERKINTKNIFDEIYAASRLTAFQVQLSPHHLNPKNFVKSIHEFRKFCESRVINMTFDSIKEEVKKYSESNMEVGSCACLFTTGDFSPLLKDLFYELTKVRAQAERLHLDIIKLHPDDIFGKISVRY